MSEEKSGGKRVEIDILSLFPNYFVGPLNESILKRAQQQGLISIRHTQIRDFASGRHKRVDDRPYGGGPGMVLKPEPVTLAIQHVRREDSHVIYMSPQGSLLNSAKCRQLSQMSHLVLLCGHYEGIDERVLLSEVDEEISIGDYVLTNGALAALVLLDALSRFIPGVLGNERAADEDSFESGIFDCPHYTRPEVFDGIGVPKVLLEGNHAQIAAWRQQAAVVKTREKRPDLYADYQKKGKV